MTYTLNPKKKQKNALANKTNYALLWYAFYDLQPGDGTILFLQPRRPHGAG